MLTQSFTGTRVQMTAQAQVLLQLYSHVCWRMLTYADVCWRTAGARQLKRKFSFCFMLTYADVCWRIVADDSSSASSPSLCWRMLTYADVSRRMTAQAQVLLLLDRRQSRSAAGRLRSSYCWRHDVVHASARFRRLLTKPLPLPTASTNETSAFTMLDEENNLISLDGVFFLSLFLWHKICITLKDTSNSKIPEKFSLSLLSPPDSPVVVLVLCLFSFSNTVTFRTHSVKNNSVPLSSIGNESERYW